MTTERNAGFQCPVCDYKTKVNDSRSHVAGGLRRRRECLRADCGYRFSTLERLAGQREKKNQFKGTPLLYLEPEDPLSDGDKGPRPDLHKHAPGDQIGLDTTGGTR